jgi:adenylate kinase
MRLVLLGPPGAGKGTQAARIAEAFSLVHLSSGDILRAERKAKTELGRQAQDYMDRGVLVPDDLILNMMMDHITRSGGKGFLLDGFPRTVVQAEGLDQRLAAKGMRLGAVINMEVADEEVTKRLTGRWSCPKDGRIYHEQFSPPANKGICDDCGTALARRKDDDPTVVRQRLQTYHAETEPLVKYYQTSGILRSIDAGGGVDEVTAAIKRASKGL